MAALLELIRVWLEQLIMAIGYAGILFAMFVENLFPPIPSEAILLFSGFLVKTGDLTFIGVLAASVLGSLVGAIAIYYLGVWADEPVLRRFVRRYGRYLFLPEAQLDQALQVFGRHGQKMVFFGRMIPVVRSLISVPAGLNRMPLGRFILLTLAGSTIWNTFLTGAGVVLGQNWERMLAFTERYEHLVLVTLAATVLVWFGRILARRWFRTQRPDFSLRPSTIRMAVVPIPDHDEPTDVIVKTGTESPEGSYEP